MSESEQEWRRLDLTGSSQQTVTSLFDAIAATYGSHVAISSDDGSQTYASLGDATSRLAHGLIAGPGTRGDRVAIVMDHGAPLITAALGVLKAARIVVVTNVTEPADRLRGVIADAAPTVLLTDASNVGLADALKPAGGCVLRFDDVIHRAPARHPGLAIGGLAIGPDDVAYLVYTSGSTGRVRGAMMTHRYAVHNVYKHAGAMDIRADDRIALIATLSSTVGVTSMHVGLLNGACLCPYPVASRGAEGLAAWLIEQRISVYVSTVSLFRHAIRNIARDLRLPHLRTVEITSEPATADDFELFKAHCGDGSVLVHNFGSTETGAMAFVHLTHADAVPPGRLPLGHVAKGVDLALLGEDGARAKPGEIGEIVVRSHGLSPGYWVKDADADRRFFRDAAPEGRLGYRTGDLGRVDAAGRLVFAGRKDDLIKVRGNRFAPTEVEDAIRRVAGVAEVACLGLPRDGGGHELAAFVVTKSDAILSEREIRQALMLNLPGYMLPKTIVFADRIPLSVHNKVDRAALLRELPARRGGARADPPRTPTEMELVRRWEHIFALPEIHRHDHFFELGGDSLDASELVADVGRKFSIGIDYETIVHHPTLSELAALIDCRGGSAREESFPIARAPRDQLIPMTWSQRHQFDDFQYAAPRYTVARTCRIEGDLDVGRLRDCMTELVNRHEVLRTTFDLVDGRHVQIIHPPRPVDLDYRDLSDRADAEAEAERLFAAVTARVLNPSVLPLVQFTLLRLREREYRFLRIYHHIILDAPSWSLFFRELAELYETDRRAAAPSPSERLQCADYAVWQRGIVDPASPSYRESLSWWRAQYADCPPPMALPFRAPARWSSAKPSDGIIGWTLPPDVSRRIDRLARSAHATFFSVNLAVFAALMGDAVGRDVIVGTNFTNRGHADLKDIVGDLASLAPLRLRCRAEVPFIEWLAEVRHRLVETEPHARLQYSLLRHEMRDERSRLPDLTCQFVMDETPASRRFGGLQWTWDLRRTETMPWGFAIECEQRATGDRFRAAFDAGRYRRADVEAFVARYRRLHDAVAVHPERSVAELLAASRERGWIARLRDIGRSAR